MWKAKLSNDETVIQDESQIIAWRNLVEKCRKENLKISSITYNNEVPHPPGSMSSYFVIYDMRITNISQGGSLPNVKIGIGGYIKGLNKCRIKWYKLQGNPVIYTELVNDPPECYKDFCIEAQ